MTALAMSPERSRPQSLRPLGLAQALLWFGIPAAVFSAVLLGILPVLVRRGIAPFLIFNLTFALGLALLLVAAVVAYRLEGRPLEWRAFAARMRLERPGASAILWGIAAGAFSDLYGFVLEPLLARMPPVVIYTPPPEFPAFMQSAFAAEGNFLGIPLAGAWWVIVYYMVALLVLNIMGEELWWRGYILPRQELAHGKWAWVVNGTLWAAFHIFYHASLASFLTMLPGTLALAYACQRSRSTWTGIIAHTIQNGAIPLLLLKGILAV